MQTIQDFIDVCRFQLQDETVGAYRYADTKFTLGMSVAFDECYRLRPDIFVKVDAPVVTGVPLTTVPPVPRGYQMAFVYYMCGFVTMSNQEDTEDARAAVFLNKFVAQMMQTAA